VRIGRAAPSPHPCWCCGAAPDPTFGALTCACSIFRCLAHRDDETCVSLLPHALGECAGEPEEPDDEEPGLA
jgi:hypothetical protein